MIQFYTATTPNGRKVSIFLEEAGLAYQTHTLNFKDNDQLKPEYLALNPNNKIPAIVDEDAPGGPLTVIESGAILLYLAEKTGKFLSTDPRVRSETIQWLMFQMSAVGPMFGQAYHFALVAPEKLTYAIDRFQKEVGRILRVLEVRLTGRDFLAGEYSIADMATFPWVGPTLARFALLAEIELPQLKRWAKTIEERPAVQHGMKIP
jgi:GSH-dependent disulfide-bond oxidoreductase